jgi:hypothetical protein
MTMMHEHEYELDEERRESLVPGLIKRAEDRFLDQYTELFPLIHFVRMKRRTRGSTETPPRAAVSGASGPSGEGFAASTRFRRRPVS